MFLRYIWVLSNQPNLVKVWKVLGKWLAFKEPDNGNMIENTGNIVMTDKYDWKFNCAHWFINVMWLKWSENSEFANSIWFNQYVELIISLPSTGDRVDVFTPCEYHVSVYLKKVRWALPVTSPPSVYYIKKWNKSIIM